MADNKSIFGTIFDGPDSLFGQIFGESRLFSAAEQSAEPEPPVIRIALNHQKLKRLATQGKLRFKANGQVIDLVWE